MDDGVVMVALSGVAMLDKQRHRCHHQQSIGENGENGENGVNGSGISGSIHEQRTHDNDANISYIIHIVHMMIPGRCEQCCRFMAAIIPLGCFSLRIYGISLKMKAVKVWCTLSNLSFMEHSSDTHESMGE